MEFDSFIRVLRRRWIVVVVAVAVGLIGGLVMSVVSTPRYEAVSRVFLATPGWGTPVVMTNAESSPYRGNEFSQLRAATYLRMTEGQDFFFRVEARMDTAPGDIPATDAIEFRVVPDTVLVELSGSAASPERALALTEALTAEAAATIEKLETPAGTLVPVVRPTTIDSARLTDAPSEPRIWLLLSGGGVLGLLAGVTAAVVLTRTSRRLDSALQLASISSLPVLATFGEADPASMSDADNVNARASSPPVDPAGSRLRFNLEFLGPGFSAGIIAVTSPHVEAPTDTVARGLVRAASEAGKRSVLVDCTTGRVVGRDRPGLADIVLGSASIEEVVVEPVQGQGHMLGTGDVPETASGFMESTKVHDVLHELRDVFDLVVLDVPGFLETNKPAVMSIYSDAVVVVAAEAVSTLDDLTATFDGLRTVGAPLVGSVLVRSHGRNQNSFDYVAPPDPFERTRSVDGFVGQVQITSGTTGKAST
ncbi:hypothetical protein QM716_01515 [Rhodococcus sp. IEGM 1409]|uniref:hypothetical protein n=1 Tax=Rhodococcus sp. IEGM 1409 TaxID=3047082 RepID=UPI0024B72E62|nr:hypothetical protein [Rhodococcus sp. IEGM 1409]MDI9898526.1 hypothetical protein [Rhodococcus sp. IEGM 1409]